ncbi:Uncharacterized protein LHYA1_G005674 [Lachnellula hyalina]|uniref:Uncharacterized protein n=1 Tax=Lachnellula hyalina TaxID=1316788 RepID=A0A8H8U0B4_9HELO|nr:Uncharacterized protein LHYA1_G005674 [Lachnellula hyalina]TVY25871.1 Uncharacterized protein LHYA1_G005674 [Lachnellula hyalina]
MAADMDIEMDIDMGLAEGDFAITEIDIVPGTQTSSYQQESKPILTAPNDSSDSNAHEFTPEKVHLRGLDNLTTKDIKAFAAEHFDEHSPLRVEWINDTSANLVFESVDIAADALRALAAVDIGDVSQIPVMQAFPTKPFSLHPNTNLEVRAAVVGDRKQAGARESSRFYLMNPKYDPTERRKRGGQRGGNRYRDRDDGGYRSRRYDDREQQNRQDGDRLSGFDSSLYDDDEAALAQRAARGGERQDSSSGGEFRGPASERSRYRGAAGKELFPERNGDRASGRLRDRSASPMNEDRAETPRRRRRDSAASANRLKAQMLKNQLREASVSKELFPQKVGINHRRSDAFDAADETADLFSGKMAVPFTDGSGDNRHEKVDLLAPRISRKNWDNDTGFTIRGAAKAVQVQKGFNIKGAASGGQVKELFPSHFGDNSGKELFSENLEGRGRRRQKAEDLFS